MTIKTGSDAILPTATNDVHLLLGWFLLDFPTCLRHNSIKIALQRLQCSVRQTRVLKLAGEEVRVLEKKMWCSGLIWRRIGSFLAYAKKDNLNSNWIVCLFRQLLYKAENVVTINVRSIGLWFGLAWLNHWQREDRSCLVVLRDQIKRRDDDRSIDRSVMHSSK